MATRVPLTTGERKRSRVMELAEDRVQSENHRLKIVDLLRPHSRALVIGFLAVIGEGVANLLEPWPLKIVLDNVLKSGPIHGWLNDLIASRGGTHPMDILTLAA